MDTEIVGKDVLEKITYGYYIVATRMNGEKLATRDEDYISAGTVSWLMQTSFEPPMVTIAIEKGSHLNETIGRAKAFAVNILGENDRALVEDFAREIDVDGQRINNHHFTNGKETNCPVIGRGIGYLECRVVGMPESYGDHTLFIGEVVNSELIAPKAKPLHEWETGKHYGGFRK